MSSAQLLRQSLFLGIRNTASQAALTTLTGSVFVGSGVVDIHHRCNCHQVVDGSTTRRAHTASMLDSDGEDDDTRPAHAQLHQLRTLNPNHQQVAAAALKAAANPPRAIEGPLAKYEEGRDAGLYRSDPRQETTIRILQEVFLELRTEYPPPIRPSGLTMMDNIAVKQSKSSWFAGVSHLLRSQGGLKPQPGLKPAHHIIGLYMYGGVGVGKTMLMDLFVHSAPKEFQVVRTHFHDFMLDVHTQLQQFKDRPQPLLAVADSIASKVKVLCLDELFVTDVADAMILNRLFTRLWERGLTLIATSNRAPDELYKGGLQRQLFLPFIHRLKEECRVHDMASPTDYRKLAHHQQGLCLLTPEREAELRARAVVMADGKQLKEDVVRVAMGRELHVPAAAGSVCLFPFHDLCGRPLGAADYLALATRYHTLCLSGVPEFTATNRPEAYRFVTLVDVLYEHRIRVVMSADAPPTGLFANIATQAEAHAQERGRSSTGHDCGGTSHLVVDDNLGFVRERTISRLMEMESMEYLQAHARQHAPELLLALQESASKASGQWMGSTHICQGEGQQEVVVGKQQPQQQPHEIGFC